MDFSLACSNARQNARAKFFFQLQLLQMNIPNVAPAFLVGTQTGFEALLKMRLVDVSNFCRNEMTPPHGTITAYTENSIPSSASASPAWMIRGVDVKKR